MPEVNTPKCSSCSAPLADANAPCTRCGWARTQRRCLRCSGLIAAGANIDDLKVPGGVAAAVAGGAGLAVGFLGSLALLSTAAAAGSVIMARRLRQRCHECGTVVPERWLSSGEKQEVRDGAASGFMRAGLFGLVAAGAAAGWLVAASSSTPAAPDAGAEPSQAGVVAQPPDIAGMQARYDADGLAAVVREGSDARYPAATALGRIGPAGVRALDALLHDGREHVQRAAVSGLSEAAPQIDVAIPTLIALIERSDGHLRYEAIKVLAKTGSRARAAIPVLTRLKDDPRNGRTATEALARIESSRP